MNTETLLRRILYVGTGLVIVVALILAFMVIPSVRMDISPQANLDRAVHRIWAGIIFHLIIVTILIWTILVNHRGGRINKGLLVVAGVALIFMDLIISDRAIAYLDHPCTGMHSVVSWMFICVGFNFIVSMLAFFTSWYSERLQPPSEENESFLATIPSGCLALPVAVVVPFVFFAIGEGSDPLIKGEAISYILYDLVIVLCCFFIVKNHPKSVWYIPIICNATSIYFAVTEPNIWITTIWIPFCGGWVLSIIASAMGAWIGKRMGVNWRE